MDIGDRVRIKSMRMQQPEDDDDNAPPFEGEGIISDFLTDLVIVRDIHPWGWNVPNNGWLFFPDELELLK